MREPVDAHRENVDDEDDVTGDRAPGGFASTAFASSSEGDVGDARPDRIEPPASKDIALKRPTAFGRADAAAREEREAVAARADEDATASTGDDGQRGESGASEVVSLRDAPAPMAASAPAASDEDFDDVDNLEERWRQVAMARRLAEEDRAAEALRRRSSESLPGWEGKEARRPKSERDAASAEFERGLAEEERRQGANDRIDETGAAFSSWSSPGEGTPAEDAARAASGPREDGSGSQENGSPLAEDETSAGPVAPWERDASAPNERSEREGDAIRLAAAAELPAASETGTNDRGAAEGATERVVAERRAAALEERAERVSAIGAETGFAADASDDLKRIKGIGPILEKRLHQLGVRSFAQIAAFDEAEIARIGGELAFRGRIEREQWVEQAALLAEERLAGGA